MKQRNEQDIAVLFLVGMSNSTTGWINTAQKESLVLMVEAWKFFEIDTGFTVSQECAVHAVNSST